MSPGTHPSLLWDVLVALHLYKRPHRARAVLADTLVAAQARPQPPCAGPLGPTRRTPAFVCLACG